jgi:hypothetical protein
VATLIDKTTLFTGSGMLKRPREDDGGAYFSVGEPDAKRTSTPSWYATLSERHCHRVFLLIVLFTCFGSHRC